MIKALCFVLPRLAALGCLAFFFLSCVRSPRVEESRSRPKHADTPHHLRCWSGGNVVIDKMLADYRMYSSGGIEGHDKDGRVIEVFGQCSVEDADVTP